jgi:hypothetical protein
MDVVVVKVSDSRRSASAWLTTNLQYRALVADHQNERVRQTLGNLSMGYALASQNSCMRLRIAASGNTPRPAA